MVIYDLTVLSFMRYKASKISGDYEFDLSRLLSVKSSAIGVSIHGFLLMFNGSIWS